MAQAERVAVSLPKDIVQRVEQVRDHLGFNRRKFYQIALKAYLEEFPGEEDKKLARLYKEIEEADQKLLHDFRQQSYRHLPPYQK